MDRKIRNFLYKIFPAKVSPFTFTSQEVVDDNKLIEIKNKIQLKTAKDPFGTFSGAVVVALGDTHIPSRNPEFEPTMLFQPFKTISRIDPRNPHRYIVERPLRFKATWAAEVEELNELALEAKPQLALGSKLIIIHLGDVGTDAVLIGDFGSSFVTVGEGISSVKNAKIAMLPGDHEYDYIRYGALVRNKEMDFLGEIGWFFQRIGNKHLLLGLTTSLLNNIDDDDIKMKGWKKAQDEIIDEAKRIADNEGRKISIFGHERTMLNWVVKKMRLPVEAIISGHTHLGTLKKKGKTIVGTVGAPTFGAFGLEINVTPSMIKLVIDGNSPLNSESATQIKIKIPT